MFLYLRVKCPQQNVRSDLPSSYKIFLKRVLNSRSLANRVNVSMCVVWYDIATGDQRTIGYGSAMVCMVMAMASRWLDGRQSRAARGGTCTLQSDATSLALPYHVNFILLCWRGSASAYRINSFTFYSSRQPSAV